MSNYETSGILYDIVAAVDTMDLETEPERAEQLKNAMFGMFDILTKAMRTARPRQGSANQGRWDGRNELAQELLDVIKREVSK
jgi:hypothetical protein